MPELEKEFYYELNKIKNNVPGSSEKCMSVLRKMNNTPSYSLGEMQPIVNKAINNYCKATGESYESAVIKMTLNI